MTPTDVRFVKLKRNLLWDCTYTETFWKHVLEWITKTTPHVRSLNITEQLVIFGVKVDVTTDKVLDLIMLMAKYYIFRCRCLKNIPNFICFSKEVRQRAAIEKHAWALKGDLTAYLEKHTWALKGDLTAYLEKHTWALKGDLTAYFSL